MELEFCQKTLPYLHSLVHKAQTQELTQEVRLPEGMPDIGNVVSCWAQVVIRGKEWRGERVGANGGIMAWVLYIPEDESAPQATAAWMPFQMKWDIPQTQHDGTILLHPFLHSVDARSLSARKLMVRATFGIDMQALVPAEATVYIPEKLPEDIRLLKQTYPLCLPVEAGEKGFSVNECFTENDQQKPEQIIRGSFCPQITEWKLMADKLIFRGNILVCALYRCQQGKLHTWRREVPFSQYTQLDQEYEDTCPVRLDCILTEAELDVGPEQQFCLKAGFSCQYTVWNRMTVELVEDAYSPTRQVGVSMTRLELPWMLDRQTEKIQVEQTVEADAAQVLDLAFYVDHPQILREGHDLQIQIPGVFQLLYEDTDGSLQSTNAYWEETTALPAADNTGIGVTAGMGGLPAAGMSSNGISMQADVDADAVVFAGEGIPMVSGLELGETKKEDPNRPSLIIRRAGTDSLWTIAKETGSDVEMIRAANGLSAEPAPEQMLLIPVR